MATGIGLEAEIDKRVDLKVEAALAPFMAFLKQGQKFFNAPVGAPAAAPKVKAAAKPKAAPAAGAPSAPAAENPFKAGDKVTYAQGRGSGFPATVLEVKGRQLVLKDDRTAEQLAGKPSRGAFERDYKVVTKV